MIHAKRFIYYKNMFDRFKHDMKKTWSIISETLSRNKQNHSLPETPDACPGGRPKGPAPPPP